MAAPGPDSPPTVRSTGSTSGSTSTPGVPAAWWSARTSRSRSRPRPCCARTELGQPAGRERLVPGRRPQSGSFPDKSGEALHVMGHGEGVEGAELPELPAGRGEYGDVPG